MNNLLTTIINKILRVVNFENMSNRSILTKTPCIVAMELDYDKELIIHCYENGMSAGDLVTAILDFKETNPKSKSDGEEEISETNLNLRHKTFNFWKQQRCKKCFKNIASFVALPCGHFAVCRHCRAQSCIICELLVTDWIHVDV